MPDRPELTEDEAVSVVNIAMHPAMFGAFVDWVESRGCGVSPPLDSGFRIITVPYEAFLEQVTDD